MANPHQGQLGQGTNLRALPQSRQGLVNDLHARQHGAQPHLLGSGRHLLAAGRRSVKKRVRRATGRRRHAIAEVAEKLFEQLSHVDPFDQCTIQLGQRGGGIALGKVTYQSYQSLITGRPQHTVYVADGDLFGHEGQQLLQKRLPVAHGAGRSPGKHLDRLGFGLNTFGLDDLL